WLKEEIESHSHVILVAHQPPGYIERYPEANDELIALYEHPHVLGSVHGHTHKYNYQTFADKPVMTVTRVVDTNYVIMHVGEGMALTFERCEGSRCSF